MPAPTFTSQVARERQRDMLAQASQQRQARQALAGAFDIRRLSWRQAASIAYNCQAPKLQFSSNPQGRRKPRHPGKGVSRPPA